jgi:3-isopropylmalate dehydrogenase
MALRIGVIPGDGIGPEICAEALKVLRTTGVDHEVVSVDLGADRWLRDGVVLADEDLALLGGTDAILKGPLGAAVGDRRIPGGTIERGIILRLRFELDLFVNLRPFVGPGPKGEPLDFVVVRENTEGTYAGEGGFLRKGTPQEIATQGSVNTRHGVERCIRYAFGLAQGRPRKHLTLVHKTNVLTFAGDLWQRTFDEVAPDFPDVSTTYHHVDASCIYLVEDPSRYDVIVTDNLFGDILTDLAGAVSGGVGLAASANMDPTRRSPSFFEPVHGAAHDIAGRGVANPVSAIRSMALLLDFVGETDAGARIQAAVEKVVDSGCPDTTSAIGDAVVAAL